jgi:hypothetical protein
VESISGLRKAISPKWKKISAFGLSRMCNLFQGQGFPPKDFEMAQETNKGHGRLETRTLTVSSQLKDFLDWPFLEQVFQLQRRSIFNHTGEIREQVVYGFTSLRREEITPLQLLKKIRSCWGIENGLHDRRDVTLREDYTP